MRVHSLKGAITTIFAAEYPDGRVLILDAGSPLDYCLALKGLEDLGIKGEQVKMVFSSHAHPDHFGAAHLWKKRGVPVVGPRGINQWYSGFWGFLQQKADMGLAKFVSNAQHGEINLGACIKEILAPSAFWYPPTLDLDAEVETVDALATATGHEDGLECLVALEHKSSLKNPSLPFGFEDWICIGIPGHTDHMAALFHPASGTLYAADAMVHTHGKNFEPPYGVDFPVPAVDSIKRIGAISGVRTLLLAHGGAFSVAGKYPTAATKMLQGAMKTRDSPRIIEDFGGVLRAVRAQVVRRALSGPRRPTNGAIEFLFAVAALPHRLCPEKRRIRRVLGSLKFDTGPIWHRQK